MFRRIICALLGHKHGAMIYSNDYVTVWKCARCGTTLAVMALGYHVEMILKEDGIGNPERLVGEIYGYRNHRR